MKRSIIAVAAALFLASCSNTGSNESQHFQLQTWRVKQLKDSTIRVISLRKGFRVNDTTQARGAVGKVVLLDTVPQ